MKFFKKLDKRRECWNLNYSFILWLNERLKIYKEEASRTVDLNYHKFNWQGKEYTQLQMIDKLIELTDYLIEEERYFDWTDETDKVVKNMLEIFSLIFESLWW